LLIAAGADLTRSGRWPGGPSVFGAGVGGEVGRCAPATGLPHFGHAVGRGAISAAGGLVGSVRSARGAHTAGRWCAAVGVVRLALFCPSSFADRAVLTTAVIDDVYEGAVLHSDDGLPRWDVYAVLHYKVGNDRVQSRLTVGRCQVTCLFSYRKVPHVFQTFYPILDEAAAALDRAGQFLSAHLASAERITT
jgi:hypothetical protein